MQEKLEIEKNKYLNHLEKNEICNKENSKIQKEINEIEKNKKKLENEVANKTKMYYLFILSSQKCNYY